MAVLGPRVRRGMGRVVAGRTGARRPLLPQATRSPAAPWSVGDALVLLGAGLGFLLAALIVTLGLAQLQGIDAHQPDVRGAIGTVVAVCYYLFLLWMIQALIVHRYRCSWHTLGLRVTGWQWIAAVPFFFALLTFSYVLVLVMMVRVFGPAAKWPAPLNVATVTATQQPLLELLVIVTGVVLAPVSEELLFRGIIYQALRRRMTIGNAACVSALIFAVMHGSPLLFLPYTIMGVVLALVYERSGSLLPTMLIHACNNGILLLLALGSK